MNLLLLSIVVGVLGGSAAEKFGKFDVNHLGCFADSQQGDRVLPVYLGHHSIEQCAKLANEKGYKVFGIQNGGECWTGPDGEKDYNKHDQATNCKNGKGGSWSNDVYKIVDEKPNCKIPGFLPDNAARNCRTLKSVDPKAISDVYWLNPSGAKGAAFQGYCDMETAGGGWTLVYSYTFTNYGNFGHGSNAITPQPNWPAVGNVRRSTQSPRSETNYAAMDFNLWKEIGSEFMIKSNINHWIKCTEGEGSLMHWRTGRINCQLVRNVAPACHNIVPDRIKFVAAGSGGKDLGPDIDRTSSGTGLKEYYYLEASTQTANWPTHDPCGTNGKNHAHGVANPHGNIYVR